MHYLPFYLMGRQLFLHHYLPAHLASALVTGALLEFIFNVEPVTDDYQSSPKPGAKKQGPKKHLPAREKLAGQNLLTSWAALGVILAIVIGGWYYFLPLTYGYPGLTVPQVNARKWLGYDLHFAK
jgi:dolichyl-phosphate-mannose-protein mannosyltransferase